MRFRARPLLARAIAGAVLAGVGAAVAVAVAGAPLAVAARAVSSPTGTTTTSTTTTGTTTTGTTTTAPTKLDESSDRAALADYRAYLEALVAAEPLGRQRAASLTALVKSRCSGALTGVASLPAKQVNQTALSDLGEEIGGDLALDFLSEADTPFAQLSSQLGALTWSEPAPEETIQGLLSAEGAVLALVPSRLCADARTLAAHPLVAPRKILAFLDPYLEDSATLKERLAVFLVVLSQYATPSEDTTITVIDRLVARFAATSATVERTGAAEILTELGLTS